MATDQILGPGARSTDSAQFRDAPAEGGWNIRIVILCILIMMADGYGVQTIGVVAPAIAAKWSLNIADLGIIFTAGLAGTVPGALIAGQVVKRLGRRSAFLLTIVVFGVGSLLTALAGSVLELAALRFVVGWGLGAAAPIAVAFAAESSPSAHRAKTVMLTICGQPIGAALGAALSAKLIILFGWQSTFLVGGLLALVFVPLVAFRMPESGTLRAEHSNKQGESIANLFRAGRSRITILLWLVASLSFSITYTFVSFTPGILHDSGYSLEKSALALSFYNVGGISGALLLATLIDRFGALKILPGAMFMATVSLGCLGLSMHHLFILFAASFASGFFSYGGGLMLATLGAFLYPPWLCVTGTGWMLGIGRGGAVAGLSGVSVLLRIGLPKVDMFYLLTAMAVIQLLGIALLLFVVRKVYSGQGHSSTGQRG